MTVPTSDRCAPLFLQTQKCRSGGSRASGPFSATLVWPSFFLDLRRWRSYHEYENAVADGAFVVATGDIVVRTRWMFALLALSFVAVLYADGPGDNDPNKVRPVPRRRRRRCPRMSPTNCSNRRRQPRQGHRRTCASRSRKSPPCSNCCPTCRFITTRSHYALKYKEFYGNNRGIKRQFDSGTELI